VGVCRATAPPAATTVPISSVLLPVSETVGLAAFGRRTRFSTFGEGFSSNPSGAGPSTRDRPLICSAGVGVASAETPSRLDLGPDDGRRLCFVARPWRRDVPSTSQRSMMCRPEERASSGLPSGLGTGTTLPSALDIDRLHGAWRLSFPPRCRSRVARPGPVDADFPRPQFTRWRWAGSAPRPSALFTSMATY